MAREGSSTSRRSRLGGVILALGVLSATVVSAAPATVAADTCTDEQKPAVFPVDQLKPGMRGTGKTVIKGRDPVSFDVEILGVLDDGIAPGLDFILVKVSGPVIEKTGGIAAGFSGSPVYIGGKLAGAISYGFFAADQTVGGMTPAEAMVELFDYPGSETASSPAGLAGDLRDATSVRLGKTLRNRAADATGAEPQEFSTAKQLPVPVGISGLNDRAMEKFAELVRRSELPFVPYHASAFRDTDAAPEDRLEPGDSFAASISVGDLTFAGVGTTTAVCGDLAVGFGHPFFWVGRTRMGMNAAEVVTVVRDPSSIFGPFKIANVAEFHGRVDQDRLAGIRGVEGEIPPLVPVTSDVVNPDIDKSRHGETKAITQDEDSLWSDLPFIAAFHLLLNEDVVFDRIGDGTVHLRFSIEGTSPSGEPFRLDRTNAYFSEYDVTFLSILELLQYTARIENNPFGDETFGAIHADSAVTERHLVSEIDRVLSASSVQTELKERETLRVRGGDTIRLRVFLLEEGRTTPKSVDMTVQLPPNPKRAMLTVRGGGDNGCFFCFFFHEGGGSTKAKSFEELIENMESAERNNDLVAQVRLRSQTRKSISPRKRVIRGRERISLQIVE